MKKMRYFPYKRNNEIAKIVNLNFLYSDFLDYVPLIIAMAIRKKILVILNSVKRSQMFFQACEKYIQENNLSYKIGLIHSKFPVFKRRSEEKKWIKKYGKNSKDIDCILIGTQVLEQSLDISGDVLFTDLCPIDFLIQRIGRLWRWVKDSFGNIIIRECAFPEAFIFMPGKSNSVESWKRNIKDFHLNGIVPFVYYDYYLAKTYDVIKSLKRIEIPKDVKSLISKVYDKIYKNKSWINELHTRMLDDCCKISQEAETALLYGWLCFSGRKYQKIKV